MFDQKFLGTLSTQIDKFLSGDLMVNNAISTAILVVAVVVLRVLALRFLRKVEWGNSQEHLRWTVQVRWLSLGLLTVGLVMVWASELRALALSVVAIAAALAIATKELILCVMGSLLRAVTRNFSIGDRIEVNGIRGDVVDTGALTTTVLEIGPGHRRTGRAVVMPNSVLLGAPVVNETFTDDFVLHTISVPVHLEDWQSAKQCLLEIAQKACGPFLEQARQHMDAAARKHGLPEFSVKPTVNVQIPEAGKLNLLLRIPSPGREKGILEQKILKAYLDRASPQLKSLSSAVAYTDH